MSGSAPPGIGSLRDRVQVLRKMMMPEDEGGHAVLFVPLGTAWAKVTTLAARQNQASDARGVESNHVVILRYRRDVVPGDRLLYRGLALTVLSASDLNGQRAYLSCSCSQTAITG